MPSRSPLPSVLLAAALFGAPAAAEEAPAAPDTTCNARPEVCGKRAFEAGVKAYRAGDYGTAIGEFRRALGYKWHPAIALNLALAEVKSGRYVAALADLEAVRRSPASGASLRKQAERAVKDAETELAVIELDGAATVQVAVDGAAVDASAPLRVDPGAHVLEITTAGGAKIHRDITLAAREHLRLSVDRMREVVVVPERQRVVEAPKPPPPRPSPSHGVSPVWFYVSAGATAVLGGVSVWSALDTKAHYDDYVAVRDTASSRELQDRVDQGHGLETRTNVLWAVTGVAAAGTAVLGLVFVDWGARTEVAVSPSGAVIRGRF